MLAASLLIAALLTGGPSAQACCDWAVAGHLDDQTYIGTPEGGPRRSSHDESVLVAGWR
jgi:hypothetical protein